MGTVSEKKVLDWEEGIDRLLDFTRKEYPQAIKYTEGWVASVIWHIAIDQLVFTDMYMEHARRIREKYGVINGHEQNNQHVQGRRGYLAKGQVPSAGGCVGKSGA